MARIRTIKPTMWASEKLGRCSILSRLTFVGLISLADDEGRGRGEKRFLLGQLHPYADSVTEQDFIAAVDELESERLAAFYTVDKARYYALPGWREHQYIERPKVSTLPAVPSNHPMYRLFVPDKEGISRGPIPVGMEGKGREGMGKDLTDAPMASDFSGHRLKIGGEFRGVHVTSLTVEVARRVLREARPNAQDRAALEWWIVQKETSMTPAQLKARQGVGA